MNRRFQFAVVASSACVVGLLLFGAVHGRGASADSTPYSQLQVYGEVLSRIKADYVEEPDMQAVTAGAINGMLEAIDPFASYLSSDQYKQYKTSQGQTKPNLGLILSKRASSISIVAAIPGSPAAKANLTTGDYIEAINGVSTRDMPLAFAELLLQGEAGTSVELSVLRYRKPEPTKISLIRQPVTVPAVSGKMMDDGKGKKVGVISTMSLQGNRVKDVAARISELEKQGATSLVLDLRYCTAGAPEDGVALANLFIDKGLLGYSQGQKSPRHDYQAVAAQAVTKLPLVVITNRATVGAAEVAAAALLSQKRAQSIGERTYGDAAVRRAVNLEDGSAVILATAKFYTPDGKAIHETGVTPTTQEIEDSSAEDDNLPEGAEPAPNAKPAEDLLLRHALSYPDNNDKK